MAIKDRGGKFDVELRGRHVKRVYDLQTATMLEQVGKRQLLLGKPLQEVIDELRGGRKSDTPTLGEYRPLWLADQTKCSRGTRLAYGIALNRMADVADKLSLDEFDLAAFKRIVRHLEKRKYASGSIEQSISVLKTVLNDAVDEKVSTVRPPVRIKFLPEHEPVRPGYSLTREQHRIIVANAPQQFRTLFQVWPYIGVRMGEAVGMEWKNLDGSFYTLTRQVTIRQEVRKLKSKKRDETRTIFLPDTVVAALAEWREVNPLPLMFPGQSGGFLSRDSLARHLRTAGEAAGIKGLHPHIFRHTAGSWMLEAGATTIYAAHQLGDTLQVFTRTYAHEVDEIEKRGSVLFNQWANGDTEGTQESESAKNPA